jgi:stearoyl-CoA desaturase (Delta-9 desaturase)
MTAVYRLVGSNLVDVSVAHIVVVVVAAFVVTQLTTAATTVYLHRGLSHRALAVKPAAALVFRVIIWLTSGMRPRQWVAVHRKHHAATDTPDDPHSPKQVGYLRVQFGNVGLYKKVAGDDLAVQKYARDLPRDRLDRLFFDHSLLGLGIGTAILASITWALGFGPLVGVIAGFLHAGTYVLMGGAINGIGHMYGKRPYDNGATNVQSLALVTGGEGLHNNHHAAPTSARFSLNKGDIDPGWWLVKLLVWLRLASVRHEDVHLKSAA